MRTVLANLSRQTLLRRSIVRPPSACMSCRQEIRWYDNVPLLSYALLRGRCRHCGARISVRYPLVEFLTGMLFFYQVSNHFIRGHGVQYSGFKA